MGTRVNVQEEIKHHKQLYSGASLEMGKIHWLIQKADTEMRRKSIIEREGKFDSIEQELTPFGEEVGCDEIHWWVFEKEAQIEELLEQTESILNSVQKLKEDSFSLKEGYFPESYAELITGIRNFMENHKKEIDDLYNYISWLYGKDILAPCMLFTYRVWGSTRLFDRMIEITSNTIDEDLQTVRKCTELALGLRKNLGYTIELVYSDIWDSIAESADDEYQGPILVPKQRLLDQTSREVLNEFATYFEFLRQSLRNIILEINRYNSPNELLYRESFWKSFTRKAMSKDRIENQLWDFKKTLEMWHVTQGGEKEKFEVGFCEQVAGFANVRGGVLIIGITDSPPRRIVGIQNLENKLKFTKSVLNRYIDHTIDFIHLQPIILNDDLSQNKICLIIAIAQTKDGIPVKDEKGRFSYPERLETGLHRTSYEKIRKSKASVAHGNYDFISNLYSFLHDR